MAALPLPAFALLVGALLALVPLGGRPAMVPRPAAKPVDQPVTCRAGGVYRPPVDAPITDPFRSPPNPFGPGNRGLEYGTRPGTPVKAIGPGSVVFAGQVAGQLYVTVRHGDGLRSSYGYLGSVFVVAGERVSGGQPVGLAGPLTHLGVRCGDTYVDPSTLFDAGWRVRLVPDHWFPSEPTAVATTVEANRGPVGSG